MKIKADFLRVASHVRTAEGEKLEPEQQPAERVIVQETPVSGSLGAQFGGMKTEVVLGTTAGEMADGLRKLCASCKHFDQRAWLKMKRTWELGSLDDRKKLNAMRAAIAMTGNSKLADASDGMDGELDADHALSVMGICHPLTEIDGASPIIVHPLGSCPPEVCNATRPAGLFESKSQEASRASSAAFDRIMRMSEGKS